MRGGATIPPKREAAAKAGAGLVYHTVRLDAQDAAGMQAEAMQDVELLSNTDVLSGHGDVEDDAVARIRCVAGLEEVVEDALVAVVDDHGAIGSVALFQLVRRPATPDAPGAAPEHANHSIHRLLREPRVAGGLPGVVQHV